MRFVLLSLVVILLSGCERYRVTYVDPVIEAEVLATNRILAARIRRTQVIAEIARLNHVIRFTRNVENRIVLEAELNDRRVELDRLNVIAIGGGP